MYAVDHWKNTEEKKKDIYSYTVEKKRLSIKFQGYKHMKNLWYLKKYA